MKTKPQIIDTRVLGAVSQILDGFVHVIPRQGVKPHVLNILCWCSPMVRWGGNLEAGIDGDTCVVSHRYRGRVYG